jgi:hypothetical protein
MHGHVTEAEFLQDISGVLVGLYVAAGLMNFAAAFHWRMLAAQGRSQARIQSAVWFCVGCFFIALVPLAASEDPSTMRWISFPLAFRSAMDRILGPTLFMAGSTGAFVLLYLGRRWCTLPAVAWTGLNLTVLGMGLALTDPDFAAIVLKPDNVPIVGLVFLLGFFTWLSARKAVVNDQRLTDGQPPLEAVDNEPVLVWPDLVYIELIVAVALTALLLVWSILIRAPLEAEASTVITPNPSKAPWYFLGLQEMLLYYDPWMAGVVLPSLIILGLCAIPYLDFNQQGNGYYTIEQRRFAYLTFQFGFLVLWVLLMLIGTFFRGPNWSFFGFFETWDVHKVEVLNNVQLSERFWIDMLDRPLPLAPSDAGGFVKFFYILWREVPGLILLGAYFLWLPSLFARYSKRFASYRQRLGRPSYLVLMTLLLIMALLPVKMVCRWSFNLNYFVSMPEYFFNF